MSMEILYPHWSTRGMEPYNAKDPGRLSSLEASTIFLTDLKLSFLVDYFGPENISA